MQNINYDKFSPFRRPDWRLERVLQIASISPNNDGRCSHRDDSYIKELRQFLKRYDRPGITDEQRNRIAYENPGLYWAWRIHQLRQSPQDRLKPLILESRILTGASDQEIAKDLHCLPEVVEYYEALFFNVRDRLEAHDWVLEYCLLPSFAHGRLLLTAPGEDNAPPTDRLIIHSAFLDGSIKFFAYFGGPFILDFVLSGFRRGNIARSREEMGSWFDQYWASRLKYRSAAAALNFDVNRYNVMALFDVHKEIINIERSTDSQEQAKDQIHTAVGGLMKEIVWSVGLSGKERVKGTLMEPYDNSAAEARDAEVLMLSSGRTPDTMEGVEALQMPAPRRKDAVDASVSTPQNPQ